MWLSLLGTHTTNYAHKAFKQVHAVLISAGFSVSERGLLPGCLREHAARTEQAGGGITAGADFNNHSVITAPSEPIIDTPLLHRLCQCRLFIRWPWRHQRPRIMAIVALHSLPHFRSPSLFYHDSGLMFALKTSLRLCDLGCQAKITYFFPFRFSLRSYNSDTERTPQAAC